MLYSCALDIFGVGHSNLYQYSDNYWISLDYLFVCTLYRCKYYLFNLRSDDQIVLSLLSTHLLTWWQVFYALLTICLLFSVTDILQRTWHNTFTMMKLLVAAALVALSSCLPADNLVFSFSQYNPAGNQPFEAYWSDFKNTHSKFPFNNSQKLSWL